MALYEVSKIKVDGVEIFYRFAGQKTSPTILLLHGFPSSSHMFRNLIPQLSGKFRVYALDLPGFGFTTVPDERKYKYTFENLTNTIDAFVQALGLERFAIYIFDYGAPTGLRLALKRPQAISAIVTQNGNAYVEGFGEEFWSPLRSWWKSDSNEERKAVGNVALNFETTKWQYTNGSPHPDAIQPEAYHLDQALMDRPGNGDIQLDLLRDYQHNIDLYPKFHSFFEESGVPILAIWGKNDQIFVKAGAEAFKHHAKTARIHLLDAGHFALETNEKEIAGLVQEFFDELGIK